MGIAHVPGLFPFPKLYSQPTLKHSWSMTHWPQTRCSQLCSAWAGGTWRQRLGLSRASQIHSDRGGRCWQIPTVGSLDTCFCFCWPGFHMWPLGVHIYYTLAQDFSGKFPGRGRCKLCGSLWPSLVSHIVSLLRIPVVRTVWPEPARVPGEGK